jgi:porin
LWRVPGSDDRGLNLFFRGTTVPSDRNLMDLYFDGGFTFKGLLGSRPDDQVGVAFAWGRISPQTAAYETDLAIVSGAPQVIQNFEAVVEGTYQWKLADKWYLQPDVQYVIHPGGYIANPYVPTSKTPIPNALVLGLRTVLRF